MPWASRSSSTTAPAPGPSSALAKTVATPDVGTALQSHGAEPAFSNAAGAADQIARELPLMREVARRANIQAD